MSIKISSYTLKVSDWDTVSAEVITPSNQKAVYVFAHGAGASMNHTFMKELSLELANHQIASLRYNFLYMEQKKKRPDFPPVAHKAVAAAINKAKELFPALPLYAGGKSFGGRMTSQYLSNQELPAVKGIIFVGFPLHPAGKPSIDRADHLHLVKKPMLFLQGTRDTLAEINLIEGVCASLPTATLVKFEGADHSFKLPKQKPVPILADQINVWIDRMHR
jgi:predicted alpha/beta-hydrolase family hydrolase